MRFEVPQYIDIEDKIFGPLTWRQFVYLGGGVGIAAVLFFTTNIFIFLLFGVPAGLIGGALSFYPVNNRPFSYFLEALFNYLTGQKLYLWRHNKVQIYRQDKMVEEVEPTFSAINRPKKNIASLSRKLELQALQKTE